MPNARLALYLTRSLMHIGTGEALGDIDLPVVRQITTRHPCIPSTAQKRALKDGLPLGATAFTAGQLRALFGADAEADSESAPDDVSAPRRGVTGMLSPQEGQLLLLPVACGAGGGAWITSPSVWQRFRRTAALAGVTAPALPARPNSNSACCPADSALCTRLGPPATGNAWVVLGPAPLGHQPPTDEAAASTHAAWAQWVATTCFATDDSDWQALVAGSLAIVSDEVFDLLLPYGLLDRARNQVGEETVQLWREEAVPDNTVFYALFCAQPLQNHRRQFASAEDALVALQAQVGSQGLALQVGGNSSLGQGFTNLQFVSPTTEQHDG